LHASSFGAAVPGLVSTGLELLVLLQSDRPVIAPAAAGREDECERRPAALLVLALTPLGGIAGVLPGVCLLVFILVGGGVDAIVRSRMKGVERIAIIVEEGRQKKIKCVKKKSGSTVSGAVWGSEN
jgi:hypothetical protein